MKTYPDFTWEHIIQTTEMLRAEFLNNLANQTEPSPKTFKGYQIAQEIIDVISELKAHPQLEKLIPMQSLMTLRWFPRENYEIHLNGTGDKNTYRIVVFEHVNWEEPDTLETKFVPLNQVANELYALIQKYRDDA